MQSQPARLLSAVVLAVAGTLAAAQSPPPSIPVPIPDSASKPLGAGWVALTVILTLLVFALLVYACVRTIRGNEHSRLFMGWVHFDKQRRSIGVNTQCPKGGLDAEYSVHISSFPAEADEKDRIGVANV